MATKIITKQIVDIESFVDDKDSLTLSESKTYTDTKSINSENNSKSYTDAEILTLNSSVVDMDNAVRNDLENYTDIKVTDLENSLTNDIDDKLFFYDMSTVIDQKLLDTLDEAKAFAVLRDSTLLATANSNAQYWDSLVLQAAQDYVDGQLGSSGFGPLKYEDGYTDGAISGLVPTTSADLTTTIFPQIIYVNGGFRFETLEDTHTFTASTDTYVDIDDNGVLFYNEVANGASKPSIPTGGIRLYKIITDGSSIVSVDDRREIIKFYQNDSEILDVVQQSLDDKADITYVDGRDTQILNESKQYTDDEVQDLSNYVDTQDLLKQDLSEKGIANGYAGLDNNGFVPAAQLPSYVDDVLEFADFASLPTTGENGKIYITLDDGRTYRWSGSAYAPLSNVDLSAVEQDIIPYSNNTYSLGSEEKNWRDTYTYNLKSTNSYSEKYKTYGESFKLQNAVEYTYGRYQDNDLKLVDNYIIPFKTNDVIDDEIMNFGTETLVEDTLTKIGDSYFKVGDSIDSVYKLTIDLKNEGTIKALFRIYLKVNGSSKLYKAINVLPGKLLRFVDLLQTNIDFVDGDEIELYIKAQEDNCKIDYSNGIIYTKVSGDYTNAEIDTKFQDAIDYTDTSLQTYYTKSETDDLLDDKVTIGSSTTLGTLTVTNLDGTLSDIFALKGIVPNATKSYNLGNDTHRWNNISTDGIDNSGFSKLGDESQYIKTKKLYGTTGSAEGDIIDISHGLDGGKIISFTFLVHQNSGEGIPNGFTWIAGYEAQVYFTNSNFRVKNMNSNSGSILSKPFTIYVTYGQ